MKRCERGLLHHLSCRRWWLLLLIALLSPLHANEEMEALEHELSSMERLVDSYLTSLWERRFDEAEQTVGKIARQSAILHGLGEAAHNMSWVFYANNILHHAQELSTSTKRHDGVNAFYLASTMLNHLGEIEASIPEWLRYNLDQQLHRLDHGIADQDKRLVRDAAEEIHTSAHKMLMSVASSGHVYRHTRWTGGIIQLNGLGDALIDHANHDRWDEIPAIREKVERLVERWRASFK